MTQILNSIKKHRITAGVFGFSFALVAGGWLWAWLYLKKIDQTLILHFNDISGINLVGKVGDLAGFGVLALVVVAMNFVLALALEDRSWFLGKLLAAATLAFAVLIFIGFAAIISVN
jgi:hypothetical protein